MVFDHLDILDILMLSGDLKKKSNNPETIIYHGLKGFGGIGHGDFLIDLAVILGTCFDKGRLLRIPIISRKPQFYL